MRTSVPRDSRQVQIDFINTWRIHQANQYLAVQMRMHLRTVVGLTRNPWIPDQVRDDKPGARASLNRIEIRRTAADSAVTAKAGQRHIALKQEWNQYATA
jgi:hypothetical protein